MVTGIPPSSPILVTGGSGFVGSSLLRVLKNRGYAKITSLSRNIPSEAERVSGVQYVSSDVTRRDELAVHMSGHAALFHLAASTAHHAGAAERQAVTVGGWRNTIELARELGYQKVVLCSSVAALGHTQGTLADETYRRSNDFFNAYEKSKYLVHEDACRLIAEGMPIIVTMPGIVFGENDPHFGQVFQQVIKKIPILIGAESMFTFVHVDDVAEGMVLAFEKGTLGQSYILTTENMKFGEFYRRVAVAAGVRPPPLRMPRAAALAIAGLLEVGAKAIPGIRAPVDLETIRTLYDNHMAFSAEKAHRELGWHPASMEARIRQTVLWYASKMGVDLPRRAAPPEQEPPRSRTNG